MAYNILILPNMSAQYILEMRKMGKIAIFIFILSALMQSCMCRRLNDGTEATATSPKLRNGFPKFPEDNSTIAGDNQLNCGEPTVYHAPLKKIPLQPQFKIVGGSTAPYGAYPWMAEIQRYNRLDGDWQHRCGGTLVSDLHIITAAHCIYSYDHDKQLFRIVMGDHHLDAEDAWQATYAVDRWVLHPGFQDVSQHSNNIAIIKLLNPVVMSSNVQPACLPTATTPRSSKTWCVVSGWGLRQAERETSPANTLQAAAVPLIEDDLCKSEKYYGELLFRPGMMCAGYEQGQIDACAYDSGGPLTCEINGRHILMGAVSWGNGCGKKYKPGVYSNVPYYLDWIHNTMEELKI